MLWLFPLLISASTSSAPATLEVEIDGLRNQKGEIRACLMSNKALFPDCGSDRNAMKQSVAATSPHLSFTSFAPGTYALVLFHDENANSKLDTLLGIPREGFGFSRNPTVRFGTPRFEKVGMELGPGLTRIRVRLQYLL